MAQAVRHRETNTEDRIRDLRETVASVILGMRPADAIEAVQGLSKELLTVYEGLAPELRRLSRQMTIYSTFEGAL